MKRGEYPRTTVRIFFSKNRTKERLVRKAASQKRGRWRAGRHPRDGARGRAADAGDSGCWDWWAGVRGACDRKRALARARDGLRALRKAFCCRDARRIQRAAPQGGARWRRSVREGAAPRGPALLWRDPLGVRRERERRAQQRRSLVTRSGQVQGV